MRSRHRLLPRYAAASLLCLSASFLAACGRTGLLADGVEEPSESVREAETPVAHASIEASVDAPVDIGNEPAPPPGNDDGKGCQPSEEICNGVDDDCNGNVDDLLPIPCPGGGSRYCVAGRWSACPQRCEVCLPGSERVCYLSYCLYWGVETCAVDGKSFGPCRERKPPPECADTAKRYQDSAELERCCIDNGYCCLDEHDLDGDGNRSEALGQCGEVLCQP